MNISELREALHEMSDPAFTDFVLNFGGDFHDREGVVRAFVDNQTLERRLCHLLGLSTEEEKTVQAATAAASSARWSAVAAAIATAIAFIALGITIYSALK